MGCSEGDKAILEDSSQWGGQAGSSTERVRGIFGLAGHAEQDPGDDGLLSPRLDTTVTADAGIRLCLASQLFKHTAVTYRTGDIDQIPPAAPKMPRAPAQHPLPPTKPRRAATRGLSTHERAVSGCGTPLHPVWHIWSCREQHTQDPKILKQPLAFTYLGPRSHLKILSPL